MKKIFSLVVISFHFILFGFAEEGMLIPSVIEAFEDDMKAMGMKLSAEDIYSINHASLKDAIIHFGGGCTAEIVSPKGLIFTNHHCGYYYIQQHSSLQNDYLKNGFWAKTMKDELPNPGLTATRIVRIVDVTKEVLKEGAIQENIKNIIKKLTAETHYEADVKAFDYGNSYYCMIKETFKDVRLVGTPPNSIGKFGGDLDNWVWPRHTGDFSVFRIYADKDNNPASYNEDNVPYQPIKYLPIDAGKRTEGQFTMVYGFPGETEQHLISDEVAYFQNVERPKRIHFRDLSLAVINDGMKNSDKIRIQYASKQARIANAWKKWMGQVQGLKEMDAVAKKIAYEKTYNEKVATNQDWQKKYGGVTEKLNELSKTNEIAQTDYASYVEFYYVGPEFFKMTEKLKTFKEKYNSYKTDGKEELEKKNLISSVQHFFKDYDVNIDRKIFEAQFPYFLKNYYYENSDSYDPKLIDKLANLIFTKSIFTNEEKLTDFVNRYSEKQIKRLENDPAYSLTLLIQNDFNDRVRPALINYFQQKNALLKTYVAGKYEMFPNEKHWPDANSTLRISYGKLEGTFPKDGLEYVTNTTVNGILAKYNSGESDYELTPEVHRFLQSKDYGKYAQDGEMWVCTLSSNHTTGGNSGSPLISGEGALLGLNFDRTWESTMSDFNFDATICRNISVDVRYVLWIIDKYAGMQRLIDEMDIRF